LEHEMNVNVKALTLAVDTILAAVADKAGHSKAASKDGKNASDALRAYATLTAAEGVPVAGAKAYLADRMKAAKVPDGTVKPYAQSFAGYRAAIAEGVDIDKAGKGGKPLSANVARDYLLPKVEREAKAAADAIRKEIAERLAAIKDAAELVAFRDILPAVPGAVETVAVVVMPDAAEYFAVVDEQEQAQQA
jgi:hypothetical protein